MKQRIIRYNNKPSYFNCAFYFVICKHDLGNTLIYFLLSVTSSRCNINLAVTFQLYGKIVQRWQKRQNIKSWCRLLLIQNHSNSNIYEYNMSHWHFKIQMHLRKDYWKSWDNLIPLIFQPHLKALHYMMPIKCHITMLSWTLFSRSCRYDLQINKNTRNRRSFLRRSPSSWSWLICPNANFLHYPSIPWYA